MIVTAAHGDTVVILDTDDQNYGGPDIVDDLCRKGQRHPGHDRRAVDR